MESVVGIVHRITYQNPDNGYCVLKVKPTKVMNTDRNLGYLFDKEMDKDQTYTITGNLIMLREDDVVEFLGEWKSHTKYGAYLDVSQYRVQTPRTVEGLKRYLATSRFKGIGPSTAEAMIDTFGEKLPEIIEKSPEKLSKIRGITKEKADEIAKSWELARDERDHMISLQGMGLSALLSQKVFELYGTDSTNKVQENPYALAYDVWGVGFKKADQIGQSLGFTQDHPYRVRAGISFVLQQAQDEGHMYLPMDEIVENGRTLIQVNPETIQSELDQMIANGDLIMEDHDGIRVVYLKYLYTIEKNLAALVQDKINASSSVSKLKQFMTADVVGDINKVLTELNIELAPEQQQAVIQAVTKQFSILTGGPGTGKSTTIHTIIKLLQEYRYSYVMTAPTGRAAKRMSEITGEKAQTIHRLLRLKPQGAAEYNAENTLPFDMVIVDEVSMLDVHLASALIEAVAEGAHLLFVGDADQLPSVQAGNVLADLLSSRAVPRTELKTIFRQAANSSIITNAHRIRGGHFPQLEEHPTDFYFTNVEDADQARQTVVDLVTTRVPNEFGFDPKKDVQILAPLYKTKAGVSILNDEIQQALNPAKRSVSEVKVGFTTFREGDRVMQLLNNYEKGVFNGEIGEIVSILKTGSDLELQVSYEDDDSSRIVNYSRDELFEITLAYALTVHKSQGSEFPVVIMPVITAHFIMLQRNLVYTAITRAKKLVVIVGSKKAMFMALKNDKPQLRYSGLTRRIK